jgi:hypothetical protein
MPCPRGVLSALAVVGILAACDNAPDAGPTAPQFQLSGLACKPATVQKLARSVFGNGSAGLAAAQLITTNQTANVAPAFTIFNEIGKKAAGGLTGQPKWDAANLTVQTIACAAVASSDPSVNALEDTVQFGQALELKGAYAVRGLNANDNADVKSHNADLLTALQVAGAAGIRAPSGAAGGFRAWQGGRVLFYGYPRVSPPFISSEAPPTSGRTAFDWFTVKPLVPDVAATADLSGTFGICLNVPDGEAPKLRLQHEQTITPISTFEVCPNVIGFMLDSDRTGRPLTGLEWLAQTFFAPTELHAATLLLTTSPGGTAKKFSPYEVVNPASVQLAFGNQPADGFVNQPIPSTVPNAPITVTAKGAEDTPWEDVAIQIFGINNNGLKVAFTNSVAVTDATGTAAFPSIASPKTGGFNLYAVTLPPGNDPDVANFAADTTAAGQRINIRP